MACFGLILGMLTFLASVQAYLFAIFDRYHFQAILGMTITLPILLTSWLKVPSRQTFLVSVVSLIGVGLWAVGAQHDYFAWNEARWKLLRRAEASGIPAREIDGGYEVNGWLTFERGRPNADDPECGLRQLWFCSSRRYQIAINLEEGRREILRERVNSWLGDFPDLLLTGR